jgi:hypothetical protein
MQIHVGLVQSGHHHHIDWSCHDIAEKLLIWSKTTILKKSKQ